MTFIASAITAQHALQQIMEVSVQQKAYLANWSTKLTGNITAIEAMEIVANVTRVDALFTSLAATPGLATYAKDQFGSETYDIVAEYNAMKNAFLAIKSWIVSALPSTSLTVTSGVAVGQVFTPAATAPLRALVQAAALTIE